MEQVGTVFFRSFITSDYELIGLGHVFENLPVHLLTFTVGAFAVRNILMHLRK